MLVLSYKVLKSREFQNALNAIGRLKGLATKHACAIARLMQKLNQEREIADKIYVDMVEEYVARDAEGKKIPVEGQPPGSWKLDPAKLDDFNAKSKEHEAHTVEIDRAGLDIKVFAKHLSPVEILALDAVWLPYNEADLGD